MDRSVYTTSQGYGSYTEFSQNDPGFWKGRFRGAVPSHRHDYLWHRIDVKDPLVQTYQGLKRCADAIGTYSMRGCLIDGYVPIPTRTGPYPSCPKLADMIGRVEGRLNRKVRESDVNLGVALGELHQTADFISSAMLKTALSYRQLRRGDVSAALQTLTGKFNDTWRDIPGVAANSWLAYSYGLRPLLSDVYGACAAIQRANKPYFDVHQVTAFEQSPFDVYVENVFGPNRFDKRRLVGEVSVRGKVRFRVSNPILHTLDQVGLTNPVSIAWELVPFSFVADWFLPIGDYINAIVPPQGVDFVDGWMTVRASGSLETRFYQADYADPSNAPWDTTGVTREVLKQRVMLSSIPQVSFTVPDISLSREKIASGLALLAQAATGKPRPGWPVS